MEVIPLNLYPSSEKELGRGERSVPHEQTTSLTVLPAVPPESSTGEQVPQRQCAISLTVRPAVPPEAFTSEQVPQQQCAVSRTVPPAAPPESSTGKQVPQQQCAVFRTVSPAAPPESSTSEQVPQRKCAISLTVPPAAPPAESSAGEQVPQRQCAKSWTVPPAASSEASSDQPVQAGVISTHSAVLGLSTSSDICRICLDGPGGENLVSPCLCQGSLRLVHQSCLQRWLNISHRDTCDICSHRFQTEQRKPSFRSWVNHTRSPSKCSGTCIIVTYIILTTFIACCLCGNILSVIRMDVIGMTFSFMGTIVILLSFVMFTYIFLKDYRKWQTDNPDFIITSLASQHPASVVTVDHDDPPCSSDVT